MQQKTQCDPDESRRGEAPTPAPSGAETVQTQPERESQWDPTFSESSYGFRVGRSAHHAVKRAKRYSKTT
ncbi:hypothetical protein [Symbiopectobacterium sp. RP]|uniref:hypothetical protein n=1 Tax=Symbiopectobacterium sp. RP TaxID=3248553 RepID=UPI003D283B51